MWGLGSDTGEMGMNASPVERKKDKMAECSIQ